MRSVGTGFEVDRRALLRHAMLLLGSTTLPSGALALARNSSGAQFSSEHLQMVAAYADILIPPTNTPGAIGAGVPKAVNAMMRDWASAKTRSEFVSVLDALEASAKASAGKSLLKLSHKQRMKVVSAFDAAQIAATKVKTAKSHDDEKLQLPAISAKHLANSSSEQIASSKALNEQERSSSGARLSEARRAKDAKSVAPADDQVAVLGSHYIRLKDLVLTTYYLSEPGATKELRYELIPGVWEASMLLGNDRRAWAV